jgi:hypothetical protein
VLVDIDIVKNSGGKKVYEQYGFQGGVPTWTIMDSAQKVLVDSMKDKQNVGFPYEPHEVAHFLDALKKSCPALSDEELKVLKERLDVHCKIRKAEIEAREKSLDKR